MVLATFVQRIKKHWRTLLLLAGAMIIMLAQQHAPTTVIGQAGGEKITGELSDPQGRPVVDAKIIVHPVADDENIMARTESQDDGNWTLWLERIPDGPVVVRVERKHFEAQEFILEPAQFSQAGALDLGRLIMERRITPAFWAAGIIFLLVLLSIAFEWLHSTTASLAGLSALFLITFIGGNINPDLYIFDLERALTYINWEVIFLVMAMMIIVAIIEGTGIFQWTAFQAYRLSKGKAWVLVLILMAVTAVASALLDNFTTMLLMTPISLQIGLALGINPLALIIPEVLASNVAGISTLIGTPTNILIGAHAGIGFSDFLSYQTAGVVIALLAMAGYVLFHYREEWRKQSHGISPRLYNKMKENAQIEDIDALIKSGIVFVLVLAGFIVGERYHVVPAVPALIGATVLLVWLNPDVQKMIKAVDWTTLVFFMAIFIVIGSIQEVGLIGFIAGAMSDVIQENLVLGIFVVLFGTGTLSVLVANIPLAASMLPIVDFLSGSIPGAGSKVLYYALSMGAAMGGNGTLIGGEANLVTAGISAQAGTPITFKEFLKVGLPVTYISMVIGFLWLVLKFVVLAG